MVKERFYIDKKDYIHLKEKYPSYDVDRLVKDIIDDCDNSPFPDKSKVFFCEIIKEHITVHNLEPSITPKPIIEIPTSCMDILNNPELLNNIVKEIQLKVVGEENSIKTITISCAGSLVENNNVASYNEIVNSLTGAGKDFITSAVTSMWGDKVIKRTRISPAAFTYWHNSRFEPEWSWDGKILVLEDISEQVLNSDTFKVMQSSGSTATIVINNRAIDILIKGKPVMIITTAKSSPSPELVRRNSLCMLDESEEQTKNILKRQAIRAGQGIIDKPNEKNQRGTNFS